MVRKFNNFKFFVGLVISIMFVVWYIVSAVLYGAGSETSVRIIALAVCLIILAPKSELSMLERVYGYKFNWFKDPDIELIETGKINGYTAYAIGKEKIESLSQGSKYIIIFADNRNKSGMLITEYNKTFIDSNIAEVSEYLDNFAKDWRYSNSLRGLIKDIKAIREMKKSC
ncbi:hypothetical protein SAMN02745136_00518 [Anaerocolumna jejuensis DSM 15929]|uniref:Uncharacterized protein n=1 Tax=Anaerocolumna jejuensis DSM 15929 TaxID=1121322 RepID=A0A1M6KNF1_9FIRM|nr:hypothetical protein [Anaerocolumna jejuensis]SHJ60469.1 hypothetical protein SAMN02745136_00518 [Anaerocolumna jejuensis DSM 15929]